MIEEARLDLRGLGSEYSPDPPGHQLRHQPFSRIYDVSMFTRPWWTKPERAPSPGMEEARGLWTGRGCGHRTPCCPLC